MAADPALVAFLRQSVSAAEWSAFFHIGATRRLRHHLETRIGEEFALSLSSSQLAYGPPKLRTCLADAWRSSQAGQREYRCTAHQRAELAIPFSIDGEEVGIFVSPASKVPQIVGELLTILGEEIADLAEREYLRRHPRVALENDLHYNGIVGRSAPMMQLYALLDKVIQSDSTLLINGENGTGKELVARAVHYNSARKEQRFVVQNCSAFNDNLLDSELFGHKRGSFTGAVSDKQGLFEVADKGTFFLDEIGDMSPALQVKVLRVLQEGTFTPVGDTQTRHVDVRIIAATNRDLQAMVKAGSFREDLYYRVNVINLLMPPLRARADDLPLLIDFFLDASLRKKGRSTARQRKKLSADCLARLLRYPWPGNVRELENEIERLTVLAGDSELIAEDLLSPRIRKGEPILINDRQKYEVREDAASSLPDAVDALEHDLIFDVLKRNGWNKSRAAVELGISRRNLIRKVQKLGVKARE